MSRLVKPMTMEALDYGTFEAYDIDYTLQFEELIE